MRPRCLVATWCLLAGAALASAAPADELLERYRRARDEPERLAVVAALRGDPGGAATLGEVLRLDPAERVRLAAVDALLALRTDEAARALLGAVDRWDPFVVDAVVRGLARSGLPGPTATWVLEHGLREGTPDQQAALVTLLAALDQRAALPAIRKASGSDRPWRLRAAAAGALGQLDPVGSGRDLRRLAGDPQLQVRVAALEALAAVPGDATGKLLRKAARSDSDWQARLAALRSFTAHEREEARPTLLEVLRDRDLHLSLRLCALTGLEGWQDPRGIEARIEALRGAEGRLEAALTASLQALTGQPHRTHAAWRAWWKQAREGWVFPAAAPPVGDDPTRTRVRFYDLPLESSCLCFVIDASGSMLEPAGGTRAAGPTPAGTTKWDVARRELAKALEALPEGASFGLVLFHERVVPLQTTPVKASQQNVAAALRLLEQQPPAGATDLYGPLAQLFHSGEPNDPAAADRVAFDTLVLLSDGLPTAGEVQDTGELLRRVAGWNRYAQVRIHCIGLGEQNRELLAGLASQSGGRYATR